MNAVCLFLSLLVAPVAALADSLLTCRDSSGHELFRGFVRTGQPVAPEKFHRERDLPYTLAVPVNPIGLDRATFRRVTGVELKGCAGPYAKVYEKRENGHLRCASGAIKTVDAGDDAAILAAMGLPPAEIACSVIFTKDKMRGLPGGRD